MSYVDPSQSRYTGPRGTKEERPGEITSDSLAAESLNSGGDFAANQSGVAASSQPSYSTTANNTDTSGASTLSSAPDSTSRQSDDTEYETPGRSGNTHGSDDTSSYPSNDNSDYTGGPKGRGLTEGGFDSGAPNASFNNEIGTRKDPGRFAEQTFQNSNAQSGADAGYEGASSGASAGRNQGGFENLGGDTSA